MSKGEVQKKVNNGSRGLQKSSKKILKTRFLAYISAEQAAKDLLDQKATVTEELAKEVPGIKLLMRKIMRRRRGAHNKLRNLEKAQDSVNMFDEDDSDTISDLSDDLSEDLSEDSEPNFPLIEHHFSAKFQPRNFEYVKPQRAIPSGEIILVEESVTDSTSAHEDESSLGPIEYDHVRRQRIMNIKFDPSLQSQIFEVESWNNDCERSISNMTRDELISANPMVLLEFYEDKLKNLDEFQGISLVKPLFTS